MILIDRITVNYHLIKMMLSSLLIGILRMVGPPVIKGIIHVNNNPCEQGNFPSVLVRQYNGKYILYKYYLSFVLFFILFIFYFILFYLFNYLLFILKIKILTKMLLL